MNNARRMIIGLAGLVLALSAAGPAQAQTEFRVMTWNIRNGGREDGDEVGPRRVVDVIRDSGSDVVAVQETYGSGERLADGLGWHLHARGKNVSILSRYPVIEDLSVFEEFKCVGALLELPDARRVAVFSLWLPYAEDIWLRDRRTAADEAELLAACEPSFTDLRALLAQIQQRLSAPQYDGVPIIIAGDFNSMSHQDYRPSMQDQFGRAVNWRTTQLLTDAGFRDAWRETHPEVDRTGDRTWSPRFPEQEQDRIDFVFHRGGGLCAADAEVIDEHPDQFPSDHAAVAVSFLWPATPPESAFSLRTVSYNIRHGEGTDGRLDLRRTAAVLEHLAPDIVGLQEVDHTAARSGRVDQAESLGRSLGMESAFGRFMDFQGGGYGLAILSRYPMETVREIRLPDGNEPRVALAATLRLPDNRRIVVVNLHFDWVHDDEYRFAQATRLSEALAQLELPYLLLGDFNDERESRTVRLLSQGTVEARKPADDRLTWSSTDPRVEIDYLFAAPRTAWQIPYCRVLDAPRTSDHRPVLAILRLTGSHP